MLVGSRRRYWKHVRIEIYRAVIRGRLDLHELIVDQGFTLGDCIVEDFADFSHTTFKGDFVLSETLFVSGVFFQNATFNHGATLQRTRFEGAPITFENAHFLDRFDAEGARFASKDGGTAVFTQVRFDSAADFASSVFTINAHFIKTQFGGQGFFPGVKFEASADFSRAHFSDVTTFGVGAPETFNASFRGQAFFIETQFDSTASFNGVAFESDLNLFSAKFGPLVQFVAATFKGPVIFDRIDVAGAAQFGPAISNMTIPSAQGAHFMRPASFSDAHFGSLVRFDKVTFDDRADFIGGHFDNDAHFDDTVFQGAASFRSSVFRALFFSPVPINGNSQFGNSVDLLGCTYDRIQVDWRMLLRYPDGRPRVRPYNRQPYIELEEVLRKAGAESDADDVYLERRRVERGDLPFVRRLWDWGYWLVANYGINLWNEFIIAVVLLFAGMMVFMRPDAVKRAEDEAAKRCKIYWYEALALALHQFLPFSLPLKPAWVPSKPYAAFSANILQVVGWILIPLAAATLAGVLRHAAR